jgi:hypothetical protein
MKAMKAMKAAVRACKAHMALQGLTKPCNVL